jgi:hypothetical protein
MKARFDVPPLTPTLSPEYEGEGARRSFTPSRLPGSLVELIASEAQAPFAFEP